jgi:hypothetical protein
VAVATRFTEGSLAVVRGGRYLEVGRAEEGAGAVYTKHLIVSRDYSWSREAEISGSISSMRRDREAV